jgi:hypothetical protein
MKKECAEKKKGYPEATFGVFDGRWGTVDG